MEVILSFLASVLLLGASGPLLPFYRGLVAGVVAVTGSEVQLLLTNFALLAMTETSVAISFNALY